MLYTKVKNRKVTWILLCFWADAPEKKQCPNIKHAARSPVFVFCFVNQCTFLHWFWIRCSSCMLQGYKLFAHACHLLGHFLPSALDFSLYEISTCFCVLTCWIWLSKQDLYKTPKSAPIPGHEMQSTLMCVSLWILCSYQLLQDEKLSIQQPQRKKPIPSPTSHINAANLHTEPTLVRQQLKPGPLVEGLARPDHRSIKLISICSPLVASSRHSSSGGADCGDCLLAVITIIFASDALHMTERNWAVILVIRSLMNELANKQLQLLWLEF